MTLKINTDTTIQNIQLRFQIAFPFLKIEFSDKPHKTGESITGGHWYDPSIPILSIAKKPHTGTIQIQPWHKTGHVEDLFQKNFGLYPQVFRKDRGEWIQTAGTDMFTLDEQNEIGRKLVDSTSGNSWLERESLL